MGLALHYKFDETGGTSVADSSGNNLHGTAAGITASSGPRFVAGRPGGNNCMDFDGVDDIVALTAAAGALPDLTAAKTVAFWMNIDDNNHENMWTILAMGDLVNVGAQVGTYFGRPAAWRWKQATPPVVVDSADRPSQAWHHVAFVYETTPAPAKWTIYIDGVFKRTVDFTNQTGTARRLIVGSYSDDTTTFGFEMYAGLLDDLRIYRRVLTQAEITRLFTGP